MNYNNTTVPLIDTKLLQLQTIDKELNIKLCSYKQMANDYLQIMTGSNKTLVSYPNMEFWGSSGIEDGFVTDEQECMNMCSNNSLCRGATYDKKTRHCWARSGESQIIQNNNTIAIIPLQIAQINNMKILNSEILDLQNKKMDILKSINEDPLLISGQEEEDKLDIMIKKLNAENMMLDNLLKKKYTYNQEYNNTSLVVNRNNIIYNILFILVIIAIFISIYAISNKGSMNSLTIAFVCVLFLFFIINGTISLSNIYSVLIYPFAFI